MRKSRKLVWRLFFSYIFIALGALVAAGWYFTHSLDAFLEQETAVELFDRARLIENQIVPYLDPPDPAAVDFICKLSGKASETRFTVILPSGTVIGDTWETPQNMDNHATRPEIPAPWQTARRPPGASATPCSKTSSTRPSPSRGIRSRSVWFERPFRLHEWKPRSHGYGLSFGSSAESSPSWHSG